MGFSAVAGENEAILAVFEISVCLGGKKPDHDKASQRIAVAVHKADEYPESYALDRIVRVKHISGGRARAIVRQTCRPGNVWSIGKDTPEHEDLEPVFIEQLEELYGIKPGRVKFVRGARRSCCK